MRYLTSPPVPFNVVLVLGDFGVDPVDAVFANDYAASERVLHALDRVAQQYIASSVQPTIVLTGDLIYPSGVQTEQNVDRLVHTFDRFPAPAAAKLDKYAIAGNHDCEGILNPAWERMQESSRIPSWKRASKEHALFGETVLTHSHHHIRLVSLETCSLVCGFYDPKNITKKEDVNFRCLGENLQKYSTNEEFAELRKLQLEWLERNVAPKRKGEWLIVMGHFPLYSFRGNGPTPSLHPILEWMRARGVDAYLSGHDHALQQIAGNDVLDPTFLISGAGGYPLHADLKLDADHLFNRNARLIGVQDAPGFMALEFFAEELKIRFLDQAAKPTFTSVVRRKA